MRGTKVDNWLVGAACGGAVGALAAAYMWPGQVVPTAIGGAVGAVGGVVVAARGGQSAVTAGMSWFRVLALFAMLAVLVMGFVLVGGVSRAGHSDRAAAQPVDQPTDQATD
ncbi:MAG: hypothetical protein JSR86_07610 [Proteobacteria bacterium]|nr:hypothetical protein [Pseudomonadota bacterium]